MPVHPGTTKKEVHKKPSPLPHAASRTNRQNRPRPTEQQHQGSLTSPKTDAPNPHNDSGPQTPKHLVVTRTLRGTTPHQGRPQPRGAGHALGPTVPPAGPHQINGGKSRFGDRPSPAVPSWQLSVRRPVHPHISQKAPASNASTGGPGPEGIPPSK